MEFTFSKYVCGEGVGEEGVGEKGASGKRIESTYDAVVGNKQRVNSEVGGTMLEKNITN
jgi:hypothetical protein